MRNHGTISSTYFSVGGGFVVSKQVLEEENEPEFKYRYPSNRGIDLLRHCSKTNKSISELVLENEYERYGELFAKSRFADIWKVMLEAMYEGCHTTGELPGGLKVARRAAKMNKELIEIIIGVLFFDYRYRIPRREDYLALQIQMFARRT